MPASSEPVRILIVGDAHGQWDCADQRYVERSAPSQVLFVGDLGDEDVEIVRDVSELRTRKAVMLGNHDAWRSFSTRRPTDALLASLELLGEDHLGYSRRELPDAGLTLIGARPFSWGGADLRGPEVYGELYGVRSMDASAKKIVDLARAAEHQDLLILAHNGPTGLSHRSSDIYGKDFGRRPGGDWGDRDLAVALDEIRRLGLRVRAVVAGHMHDKLSGPGGRTRTRFVRRSGVSYLNPAVVPRIRSDADGSVIRYFLTTDWLGGEMVGCHEAWVDGSGSIRKSVAVTFADLDAEHGRRGDTSAGY